MRYLVLAQLYLPTWWALKQWGLSGTGMVLGTLVVGACWALAWRFERGTWKVLQ